MYRHILVPLDGSPLAEQVLDHVHRFAASEGTREITLLRAVPPVLSPAIDYSGIFPSSTDPLAALEREALDYLDGVARPFRIEGYTVHTMVTTMPAAEAIINHAEGEHADLIVIATHGRSGLSRWVFGSVTQKVVQVAPVPVLVIRPKPTVIIEDDEVEREVAQP